MLLRIACSPPSLITPMAKLQVLQTTHNTSVKFRMAPCDTRCGDPFRTSTQAGPKVTSIYQVHPCASTFPDPFHICQLQPKRPSVLLNMESAHILLSLHLHSSSCQLPDEQKMAYIMLPVLLKHLIKLICQISHCHSW